MFITRETKPAIVKKHLEDGVILKELSEEYGIHSLFHTLSAFFSSRWMIISLLCLGFSYTDLQA